MHEAVTVPPAGTDPMLIAQLEAAVERSLDEPRLVARVARAAESGQWRAAAFLLERRYPERWAPRRAREVVHDTDPGDVFAFVDELAARRRRDGDLHTPRQPR